MTFANTLDPNEAPQNFERKKYLKKLPSMQRVKLVCFSSNTINVMLWYCLDDVSIRHRDKIACRVFENKGFKMQLIYMYTLICYSF